MLRMSTQHFARKEANPLDWNRLSEEQQKLVTDIHAWLADILRALASRLGKASVQKHEKAKTQDGPAFFLPRLDDDRRAHVLLIDGARGSGKTTVLLSLLRMWALALSETSDSLAPIPNGPASEVLQGRQIVPLGILDIQPLSGQIALILQLAGRLYRVATALLRGRTGSVTEGGHLPEEDVPKSLNAWRKFARAVALGREDDPRQRLAEGNPEDFALELEQAERQRMYIVEQWHEFVNSLVGDLGLHGHRLAPLRIGKNPCFIIPVDDADMNPERGVELLELLRSLWHPNVIFLLTGDSGLFRDLLFNHYKEVCPKLPDFRARNLAMDVLGKVIPPGQRHRCRIKPSDAYGYLERAGVMPVELARHLAMPELQAALPQRWRVVLDLEQSLHGKHLTEMQVSRTLFEEAVKRSPLDFQDQDRLLNEVFKSTRDGRGWRINENVVQIHPDSLERDTLNLDERRAVAWNTSDGDRWFLHSPTQGKSTNETDQAEELPDDIVASLYIAASLSSKPPHVRVGRALSPTDYGLINSAFSFARFTYSFPWPTPEWRDPLAFRKFLSSWRKALVAELTTLATDNIHRVASLQQRDAIEYSAAHWLSAICSLADPDSAPVSGLNLSSNPLAVDESWKSLGVRIARIAQQQVAMRTQGAEYVQWARRDALFFGAKESGVRQAFRNALIDGWLEGTRALLEPKEKAPLYWQLVDQVTRGHLDELERAASEYGPLDEQADSAIGHITSASWKLMSLWKKEDSKETEAQKFRRYVKDRYGDYGDVHVLSVAIQAMDPESVDYQHVTDLFAIMFNYSMADARRNEHYKAHLRSVLMKIKLRQLPSGLGVDSADGAKWSSLWRRAELSQIEQLIILVSQTDLLGKLCSLPSAHSAWKEIISTYVSWVLPRIQTQVMTAVDELEIPKFGPHVEASKADEPRRLSIAGSPAGRMIEFRDYNKKRLLANLSNVLNPHIEATLCDMIFILRDIVADEDDDQSLQGNVDPILQKSVLFVIEKTKRFSIPIPAWPSSEDSLLSMRCLTGIHKVNALGIKYIDPFSLICGFILFSTLEIFYKRKESSAEEYVARLQQNLPTGDPKFAYQQNFWNMLSEMVRELYAAPFRGRRAAALQQWMNLGAPLFAAPDSGMSSESAAHWLRAWKNTAGDVSQPEACRRLSEFRLKRARRSLGMKSTPRQAQDLIQEINEAHSSHVWVKRIERRAMGSERS